MPRMGQELLTILEQLSLSLIYNGVRVARSLVFCVVYCRSLFVLLSIFFWPLHSLPFFDLRLLITPLVSNISWLPFVMNLPFWLYDVIRLLSFYWSNQNSYGIKIKEVIFILSQILNTIHEIIFFYKYLFHGL